MGAYTVSKLFGHQNFVVNQIIVLTIIPMGSLPFEHLAALNYDRGSFY